MMDSQLLLILIAIALMLCLIWFITRKKMCGWTNWGHNLFSIPAKIWHPKNYEELKEIVTKAYQEGMNVHAYGAGHSWSNLVPTKGYLIKTDQLDRLLEVDYEKMQVRVEAGISLHKLNCILAKHGLALSNLGRVTVQSIAGATATGTHGTGHTPTIASFITEVDLLTGVGDSQRITIDKNPSELAAARLSLGCLGIIYSLKLQCERRYVMEDHCYITDFDEMYNNREKLLEENDHWMFEWNPYNGKALCYIWNKTTLPAVTHWSKIIISALKELTLNTISVLCKPFAHLTPSLIDLRFRFSAHSPTRGESYKVLTRPYLGMRYVECEMSIKPEFLPQAVEEMKKLFRDFKEKHIYVPRVTFRFVSEEKGTLLSPTYDGDRIFISLVMPAHSPYKQVFTNYQNRMSSFDARPHWGKIHYIDRTLALKLYGNQLTEFFKIRDQFDPKKIFLNDQLRSISEKTL